MLSKKIISFCFIFFFQFIITSCCDCIETDSELTYTGLNLSALNTRGFENKEILNSVPKNSFGLSIFFQDEIKDIASLQSKLNLKSLGFNAAYAFSCDCLVNLIIVDPIVSINVFVKNMKTNEIIDVTNNFLDIDGKTINQIMAENNNDFYSQLNLDLVLLDTIPDASIFTVTAVLESGTELTKQTQLINFE